VDRICDQAACRSVSAVELLRRWWFDVLGNETYDFSGQRSYCTRGAAAIAVLDRKTGEIRKPQTADAVEYAKLVSGPPLIAAQSTALIPADVHERISDSYRLFWAWSIARNPW